MAGRLKDFLSRARQTVATPNATTRQDELSRVAPPRECDNATTRKAASEAFWRFLVRYPDGSRFEARTLPEATLAEAGRLWPDAILIEPLAETVQ